MAPFMEKALSVWYGKDAEFRRHWANFCTTIDEKYVEMLARRGITALTDDGYAAYITVTNDETTALSENLVQYEERSARADTRVSKLEERTNTMTMNPQPLGLGLQPQLSNHAHEAVGLSPGYLRPQHEYGYYAPSEVMTRVPNTQLHHLGPFGTPQELAHYAEESNKRRQGNDTVGSF